MGADGHGVTKSPFTCHGVPWECVRCFLWDSWRPARAAWDRNLPGGWTGILWIWIPALNPVSGRLYQRFFGTEGSPDFGSRVVAIGGGAFAQEKNRELLRQWPSVFLEATVSELWQRSLTDGVERPLREDPEQFAALYAERLPFYRQASVVIETTGKQLAAICAEIEGALQLGGTPEDAGSGLSRIDVTGFGTGESQ